MAKQLNNVQRVQQYLKKIFRLLNEQIFDSELEDVQIVLSNSSRCYGYYTLNKSTWIGQADGEEFHQHEIGISAQYLSSMGRDIISLVGTLAHECCHALGEQRGIRTCSRNNVYHNRRFRDIAEAHGLIVEHSEKYGYSHTSCGDRLLQFCIDNDLQDIRLNRSSDYYIPIGTGSSPSGGTTTPTTRKPSSYKLACSCCSVRATRLGINLICADCGEPLRYVGTL